MQVDVQLKILRNPMLLRYLRENSYWYKYLHRGRDAFPFFEKQMKERYKVRMQDKIENIAEGLKMVQTMMDVMR